MSDRPLITFAIFAYDFERFVAEAVRGGLAQTYSPLEIIISDDCSTDRTFGIIQQEVAGYSGPHIVRLNRNESNLGLGGNINRVMELSQGQLIVAASADDVSLPNRVEALYKDYLASGGNAFSIFSNAILIDENGKRKRRVLSAIDPESLTLSHLSKRDGPILGATHAWDRRVFDVFGPIVAEKIVAEDVIIPFRSALLGEVRFIDDTLVLYRQHQNNVNFREPADLTPREMEEMLRRHAGSHVDACKDHLEALETMSALFPERRNHLNGIRNSVLTRLREKEDHKTLLSTRNPFKRAGVIWSALRQGVRMRAIIRWSLTFFLPSIYLAYLRYMRAKDTQKNRLRVS